MRAVRGLSGVLLVSGLGFAGCVSARDEERQARSVEEIRTATARSFAQAVFYKPRDGDWEGTERTYAPLIVEDTGGEDAIAADSGKPAAELRTVNATSSTVTVKGVRHDQVTYLWHYVPDAGSTQAVSTTFRGVRMTIAPDGSPLVWEALSSDERRPILFVSTGLEQAARREFGEPLPGCKYSIERGQPQDDDPVVAKVLDDGPVPMGPYVYLGPPPRREIMTVLCRCSPSQVDSFTDTRTYALMPAELANPALGLHEFLGGTERPLDTVLRWPKNLP